MTWVYSCWINHITASACGEIPTLLLFSYFFSSAPFRESMEERAEKTRKLISMCSFCGFVEQKQKMMLLPSLYLFQVWISELSGSLLWHDRWQDLAGKETCTKKQLIQWVPDRNTEPVNRRWNMTISYLCKICSFSFFDFLILYLLNLFLKKKKKQHCFKLTCELGKGKSICLPGIGLMTPKISRNV